MADLETAVIQGLPASAAKYADWVEWPLTVETICFNDGERVEVRPGDRVLVGVFSDDSRYLSAFFDI